MHKGFPVSDGNHRFELFSLCYDVNLGLEGAIQLDNLLSFIQYFTFLFHLDRFQLCNLELFALLNVH